MIKQVGIIYPPEHIPLSYLNVKKDFNGWVNANEYFPLPFDLVFLDIGIKVINGWFTGYIWEGLRLRPQDKVIRWKRTPEDR